jgi:cytochrome P450
VRGFTFHDVEVPGGEFVCYSPYHTGRMPELWEEPEKFRPDRFLSGARTISPYALVGFGAGHRPCIGKRFARLEASVVAASIYRRFNVMVRRDRSKELFFNPAMHRKHGVPARVTRK